MEVIGEGQARELARLAHNEEIRLQQREDDHVISLLHIEDITDDADVVSTLYWWIRDEAGSEPDGGWTLVVPTARGGVLMPFKVFDIVSRDLDAHMSFSDGSALAWRVDAASSDDQPSDPVDDGPALLEPITESEYRGIEVVTRLLWEASAAKELTEEESTRIRVLARAIEDERRDTTPGKTPRWRLIGLARSAARALMQAEAVRTNLLAVGLIADAFVRIGWPTVSRILGG